MCTWKMNENNKKKFVTLPVLQKVDMKLSTFLVDISTYAMHFCE